MLISLSVAVKCQVKNHDFPTIFLLGEYGIHRAATFGDLREKTKNIAVLVGFEVMEED